MSEPIKGYRSLDPADVELINRVKDHANATAALWEEVRQRVTRTKHVPGMIPDTEPARWCAIARTELQQGYMALVRAVAQPNGF
jgi:hypothetical protein